MHDSALVVFPEGGIHMYRKDGDRDPRVKNAEDPVLLNGWAVPESGMLTFDYISGKGPRKEHHAQRDEVRTLCVGEGKAGTRMAHGIKSPRTLRTYSHAPWL